MTDALVSERIKVPTVVDQGQVDFYVDNGFLAVPNLLDKGELRRVEEVILSSWRAAGIPIRRSSRLRPSLAMTRFSPRFLPSINRIM